MKKLKIMFVILSMDCGGAERVTANLSNYWDDLGIEVVILTIKGKENDFYKVNKNIKRIYLNLSGKSKNLFTAINRNYTIIKNIRKEISKEHPDIVISMMLRSNIHLCIASLGLSYPIFIGSERNHPPQRKQKKIWNFLRKTLYSNLDVVVALTTETREWLL